MFVRNFSAMNLDIGTLAQIAELNLVIACAWGYSWTDGSNI